MKILLRQLRQLRCVSYVTCSATQKHVGFFNMAFHLPIKWLRKNRNLETLLQSTASFYKKLRLT